MVLPNKHEELKKNIIVVGADILDFIKSGPCNTDILYRKILKKNQISIDQFNDTLLFLYLIDSIEFSSFNSEVKQKGR